MSDKQASGVEREFDVDGALLSARYWVATIARPIRFINSAPPSAFTWFFIKDLRRQAGSWPENNRPTQASLDDFGDESELRADGGVERSTMFAATVKWGADSEMDDVRSIRDALESVGYQTRMATDNSQLLVMREECDEPELRTDGGKSADGMYRDGTHVALHSGGLDSTIAAHVAVRWGPADLIVHLDTGTGIDDNEEWVRSFARELGVQCWTLGTHVDYEEVVREHGFPGPSRHSIMYRRLKERQLQKLASKVSAELHCWTGVRALESDRRMRTVEPDSEHAGGRWYWHAPIHDWSKQECEEYLERFDLPRNPLWDTLGRSGDCFCGCFGSPEELIDVEAAGHADHSDWLRNLESEVETGDETGRWAWGALSDSERRAERLDDDQLTLCSDCAPAYPDGGRSQ